MSNTTLPNTITLKHETDQVTLSHAVTSGKARVAVAKILSTDNAVDDKQKKLTERIIMCGGEAQAGEAIKAMLESKDLTIDDVLDMNKVDADNVSKNNQKTYSLFRVACDQSQLTTEWKARIANDEYLEEQDIREVEQFVASFRKALGV